MAIILLLSCYYISTKKGLFFVIRIQPVTEQMILEHC